MKPEIKERVERIRNGEVPDGYRKTKVGIIPDDWGFNPLISISSMNGRIGWQGLKQSEFTMNPDDPFLITGMNFKDGKIRWEEVYHIPHNRYEEAKKIQLEIDDVLMTKDGTIGKLLYIDQIPYPSKASLNSHLLVFRPLHNKYIPKFLFYQLYSNVFKHHIELEKSGTTFFGITQEGVGKYKVLSPLLHEQQKIADILSTWDNAIELKEKQISHSNEYKKGLMQKLLLKRESRNISWTETQLIKCLIPTSYPINKPSEPYYALGIRSHCKGTLVRHIDDPEKVAMDTLYEVKENELIVNITFAWEGAITILSKKDEGKIVSHRFPTYKFNEEYAISDYFKHLIKTKWFIFQLASLSPGGAGRNRVLNKTNFLKLKVFLPSVEEQRKIANFLNFIDDKIDLLNKELNQLKEQKRGLMQLLLTGIVRVEVD